MKIALDTIDPGIIQDPVKLKRLMNSIAEIFDDHFLEYSLSDNTLEFNSSPELAENFIELIENHYHNIIPLPSLVSSIDQDIIEAGSAVREFKRHANKEIEEQDVQSIEKVKAYFAKKHDLREALDLIKTSSYRKEEAFTSLCEKRYEKYKLKCHKLFNECSENSSHLNLKKYEDFSLLFDMDNSNLTFFTKIMGRNRQMSTFVSCENGSDTRVSHMYYEYIDKVILQLQVVLDSLFEKDLNFKEKINKIAFIYWCLSHIRPFKEDSDQVCQNFTLALLKVKGIEIHDVREDVFLHLEAICQPSPRSFLKDFMNFFE